MWPSLKPSQRAAVAAVIAPVSSAAALASGWVDAAQYQNLLAVIQLGVMQAGATVDAKLQQATDNAGAGAKDIAGKAIAQFLHATPDDGKQALINFRQDDLDVAGGFRYVKLVMTQATAASLVAGLILGFDPRYGPADGGAAATQAQVVG
jgi:hypothetical protein